MPRCAKCPDFRSIHINIDGINTIGYCFSDSVPGIINSLSDTQCRSHPDNKRQLLSNKLFNNKLGVING